VRRAEEYATLGADVVVETGSETYGKRPAARAWAITRRAQRAHHRQADPSSAASAARPTAPAADRSERPHQPEEREVAADAR